MDEEVRELVSFFNECQKKEGGGGLVCICLLFSMVVCRSGGGVRAAAADQFFWRQKEFSMLQIKLRHHATGKTSGLCAPAPTVYSYNRGLLVGCRVLCVLCVCVVVFL